MAHTYRSAEGSQQVPVGAVVAVISSVAARAASDTG